MKISNKSRLTPQHNIWPIFTPILVIIIVGCILYVESVNKQIDANNQAVSIANLSRVAAIVQPVSLTATESTAYNAARKQAQKGDPKPITKWVNSIEKAGKTGLLPSIPRIVSRKIIWVDNQAILVKNSGSTNTKLSGKEEAEENMARIAKILKPVQLTPAEKSAYNTADRLYGNGYHSGWNMPMVDWMKEMEKTNKTGLVPYIPRLVINAGNRFIAVGSQTVMVKHKIVLINNQIAIK